MMLSGENGILSRAAEAKTKNDIEGTKEIIEIETLGNYDKNGNIDIDNLKTNLEGKGFNVIGQKLPIIVKKNKQEYIINSDGKVECTSNGTTIGENYNTAWIGRTIDYKSEKNDVNEWIIFGAQKNEQGKNDVIITTKNAVGTQEFEYNLKEWLGYDTKVNNSCINYVGQSGTLGTKKIKINEEIKEVRSIKLEDINNALGFKEKVNPVIINKHDFNLSL